MLEIFNMALRDNNYYVCLYDNHIYIYNYDDILIFKDDLVKVKIKGFNIIIHGNNLKILKMEEVELLINGTILGVSYE